MSHLSHPIKAPAVAIVNFTDSRQTEIHAQGCSHALKRNVVSVSARPEGQEPREDDGYGDDWYKVAPCARRAA